MNVLDMSPHNLTHTVTRGLGMLLSGVGKAKKTKEKTHSKIDVEIDL